jgi:hypothetical protein
LIEFFGIFSISEEICTFEFINKETLWKVQLSDKQNLLACGLRGPWFQSRFVQKEVWQTTFCLTSNIDLGS